jgi:hypothetical protein
LVDERSQTKRLHCATEDRDSILRLAEKKRFALAGVEAIAAFSAERQRDGAGRAAKGSSDIKPDSGVIWSL